MGIEREAVDHVARLARLDLSEDEREKMKDELTTILEHVEKIQALDLDGVEPTFHAVSLANVLRDDEVKPSLAPDLALANAPEAQDGRFKVPRIVEDQG